MIFLLKGYIMNIKRIVRNICRMVYIYSCRLIYGIDCNLVVFQSFNGKAYSDNPKAVCNYLHEIMPHVKIQWIFMDGSAAKEKLPAWIDVVDGCNAFKFYKALATCSVFVTNFVLPHVSKSQKQRFIQTWHGDKAFKKVLLDETRDFVPEQIEGYCDLAVAGSEYGKRQYESAFRYKGRILMEGTPRNDRLVQNDPDLQQALKKSLNISENIKLLLYAPTLRREASQNKQKQQIQDLNISKTLDHLEEKDGCKWICLLRAHPAMVGLSGAGDDSRIMDVSSYEDMADLLLISDMLITDYSSCAGDFALLRRPLVLYQADRQEYLEKDRTFYFDIDESPYFVAQNQEQLESIIADMTPEKVAENCDEILEFYGDCETGHAAESVAKIIKDWIER